MAKENKKQETAPDEAAAPMVDFGGVDATLTAQAKEVDPFESIPTVVPGKPGFEEGKTLAGRYVRTKRVVSDKFEAGKIDAETGEKYRDLHILRSANGVVYGIWSVGALGAAMKCLNLNDYIEVTYTGLGEKPLRPGQGKPHTFKFKGVAAAGGPLVFNWDDQDELPRTAPAMAQGAAAHQ